MSVYTSVIPAEELDINRVTACSSDPVPHRRLQRHSTHGSHCYLRQGQSQFQVKGICCTCQRLRVSAHTSDSHLTDWGVFSTLLSTWQISDIQYKLGKRFWKWHWPKGHTQWRNVQLKNGWPGDELEAWVLFKHLELPQSRERAKSHAPNPK